MPTEKRLSIFIAHPSDLLTNCQPHGDGLVAYEFINRLAERGHHLYVMADKIALSDQPHHNVKLYPANIKSENILVRRISYLAQLRKTFKQVLAEHDIDIIHQLNPVVPGITLALTGLEQSRPVVLGPIVSKDPAPSGNAVRESKKLSKKALLSLQQMQASTLLAVTPAADNRLFLSKSAARKMFYITHGIDANLFNTASTDSFDTTAPKILFIGKVTYYKGIFVLLEAFEKILQFCPSCQLSIAGSFQKDADEVRARIDGMACKSQISLLGVVPRDDIPELIQASSVVCVPSFYEPFGMVALEAMACGKPVVGSDCGGLHYLIPEEGGQLVQPKEPGELAEALLKIVQSPDLQQKMGHYNRTLVEKEYDWKEVINKLENAYYSSIAE